MRGASPVKPVLVSAWILAASQLAEASPPACMREEPAMFATASAVVTAGVNGAERRQDPATRTVSLRAAYRVVESFKGPLKRGQSVRLERSCLDEPVPRELQGYPVVDRYCRGTIGLDLPGVDAATGTPVGPAPAGREVLLFLTREYGVWTTTPRTSYLGGCTFDESTLSPAQRKGLERLQEWLSR